MPLALKDFSFQRGYCIHLCCHASIVRTKTFYSSSATKPIVSLIRFDRIEP